MSRSLAAPAVRSELSLIRAVIAGDAAAIKTFVDTMSGVLWSAAARLEGTGADGEAAFLHVVAVLKAEGHARLKAFDGRARLSTYLTLVVRDILAERLARNFAAPSDGASPHDRSPHDVWGRFVRYFDSDIRRLAARRFGRDGGPSAQEDAYQEVCLRLVENDFRRIRAYSGEGSFVGYVLTIVDRILIDLVRRDVPRRLLPAAIGRLPELDRRVYAAIVWEGLPADAERLSMTLRGRLERDPDHGEIRDAIQRIAATAPLRPATQTGRADLVSLERMMAEGSDAGLADPSPTPEDWMLLVEEERTRAELVAAVNAAAVNLAAEERLYLQTVLSAVDPLPAREIAKIMGCPVQDVYRLKRRAQRWIGAVAAQFAKNPAPPA